MNYNEFRFFEVHFGGSKNLRKLCLFTIAGISNQQMPELWGITTKVIEYIPNLRLTVYAFEISTKTDWKKSFYGFAFKH